MKISISRIRLQLGDQVVELSASQAVAVMDGLATVFREPEVVPSLTENEAVMIEFLPYQTPAKLVFIQGEHGPAATLLMLDV